MAATSPKTRFWPIVTATPCCLPLRSIAFPAISTGAFGYPLPEAAHFALQAVHEVAARLNAVRLIRFVLFDKVAVEAFQHALEDIS